VDVNNPTYMSVDGVLFIKKEMAVLQFPAGKEGDYVIPDNSTAICSYAFEGSQKLLSVTLPKNVSSIGTSPFFACTSLTSINVNSSDGVFKSIDGVLFNDAGSNLIQYPCGKSESYTIPDNVSTIKSGSFAGCYNLKNIVLSSDVASIESYAFENCNSLTSVTIPSTVTTIGFAPYYSCINLVSIIVDVDNPSFIDINGVLFSHDKTKLIQYPCGHSSTYSVPDNVTIITQQSFAGCSGLASVTIPSSVTSIDTDAFNGVSMSYVDYLGLSEPKCDESIVANPQSASTFVDVDLVCVPMKYNSTNFCAKYNVKVSSCEAFVAQHNQCYQVLEWQAADITVKKRANASLWEKKSNNCFEYECLNTSGKFAWSKCNSTGDIRRMCIDNECVTEEGESFNRDKWGVEIDVNITPNELDLDELSELLSNATGKHGVKIGTESVSTTGNVVRIVVFVDDPDVANTIAKTIEDNEKCTELYGEQSGICGSNSTRILTKEEQVFIESAVTYHTTIFLAFIFTSFITILLM